MLLEKGGGSNKHKTIECRDEWAREGLSVISIAPAVNNQVQMKQKTGRKKHTHAHNSRVLACLFAVQWVDNQTFDKMRTPQGKNGMVREAGELKKRTKQDHQFIHSEGEGV